jgi:Holliday junction resolvase-like predicted endonuclease
MPQGPKGELDVLGYDGETIAFVEIRTRTVREDISGLPQLSVSYARQSVLVRTAHRFLADRHLRDCPTRLDVLAIDNIPGRPPEIRLHKDASARSCAAPDSFLAYVALNGYTIRSAGPGHHISVH